MENRITTFNWAVFLGLCVVAASIFFAANRIANSMPHMLHGNFSGSLISHDMSDPDFMSEWQAAGFLRLDHDDFTRLLETGALAGTYTAFETTRLAWVPISVEDFITEVRRGEFQASQATPAPEPHEFEWITEYQRLFSRERLTAWLHDRMNN